MKRKTKAHDFIKKHEYPGGKNAMDSFIISHMQYPKEALEQQKEAEVWVEYELDFNGNVSWAKSIKNIGLGFDEEAIRLVKLLKFAPQNNHGIKIYSKQKIKIRFKLPQKHKDIQLKYAIIPKKTVKTKDSTAALKSFAYTIKFN